MRAIRNPETPDLFYCILDYRRSEDVLPLSTGPKQDQ